MKNNKTQPPSAVAAATFDGMHKLFLYYKQLGEATMAQVDDAQLFWQSDPEANSIAILVKHLRGNMRSRFTDFLTSDGEKEWRHRDREFEAAPTDRAGLMAMWEEGWKLFFDALEGLSAEDLGRTVYIRNEGHLVVEALQRQLAHYSYHVGQMVLLGRMQRGLLWASLSIPRGDSASFNAGKFSQEKRKRHFTEGED